MKRGSGGLNQKHKECFLTAFATAIKKDLKTSIRKRANELKVHEKTMLIAIKQDLSPDHNPLDYAIWGILENKTTAVSHQNIGSFQTAIEEEWNKMSEESILKAYKSFRWRVDTIIEKKKWLPYWIIYCFLSIFFFFCLFFKIKTNIVL